MKLRFDDMDKFISELREKRTQLDKAIQVLEGVRGPRGGRPKGVPNTRPYVKRKPRIEGKRRVWTAKDRMRIVEAYYKAKTKPNGVMELLKTEQISGSMVYRWVKDLGKVARLNGSTNGAHAQ